MIIYKATNKFNGKIYIGQTINSLEYRSNQHKRDANRVNKKNYYFINAIAKYGFQEFEWEILEECTTIEQLNEREIYYIDLFDSTNREKGYNIKLGGENGGKCSNETKHKIGNSTIAKWKDPECAKKMKAGLNKATRTWIEKSKLYFEIRKCTYCGTEFKVKPYSKKQLCSKQCLKNHFKTSNVMKRAIDSANKKNQERFDNDKQQLIEAINQWVNNNKNLLVDVKFNKLSFLNDLLKFTNVKDCRTLSSAMNVSGRKKLVEKLIEISKNVC